MDERRKKDGELLGLEKKVLELEKKGLDLTENLKRMGKILDLDVSKIRNQQKIGEGGVGCVYKGLLKSSNGGCCAVKSGRKQPDKGHTHWCEMEATRYELFQNCHMPR